MFFDEVHNIFNNKFEVIIKILIKNLKKHKMFFLSATPIKNTVADFIPLVEILCAEEIPQNMILDNPQEKHITEIKLTTNQNNLNTVIKKLKNRVSFYYSLDDKYSFPELVEIGEYLPEIDLHV